MYCSPWSNTFTTHLWHSFLISAGTLTHVCPSVVKSLICLSRWSTLSVRSSWDLTLIMGLVARKGNAARSWEGQALSYKTPVSFEVFVQSSGKAKWEEEALPLMRGVTHFYSPSIEKLVVRDSQVYLPRYPHPKLQSHTSLSEPNCDIWRLCKD